MGGFSLYHWLIVLVIVVLIFGTKRLRNIGSDLGGALRDFRKGLHESDSAEAAQLKADPTDGVANAKAANDTKREPVE